MTSTTDHHDDHDHHDHDRGLAFDLSTLMARRRAMGLGAGLVAAAGGAGWYFLRGGAPTLAATGADGLVCVQHPAEMAGPYPGDGTNSVGGATVNSLTMAGIRREDMRGSFGGMRGTAEGVELQMVLRLVDTAAACAPLAGHAVYLWHCTATGQYSMYDLPDQNFLRAVGISDDKGEVRFTSIFPGCYDGRWPHFHFEVFADAESAVTGRAALLTSQIALPEAECAALYAADARYAASVPNLTSTTLTTDMIFRNNSAEQVAAQMMAVSGDAAAGYQGRVTIGI
jgi:protocatechuate 3,4-dioxygenase beta subunit